MKRVGIIVASDQGSKGLRVDESGKKIEQMVLAEGYEVHDIIVVPDDIDILVKTMIQMTDECNCHLVLTTGGTGFSKRDNTPEATLKVIERHVPGIGEAMRWVSFQKTPKAILSRGIAGIRNNSIIINLPGSPKAVEECLSVILPPLSHGLEILHGETNECAQK